MKIRSKIVYGIAGILAFLPLSFLVILQSVFALKASYDDKLVINADENTIVDIVVYDQYNDDITNYFDAEDPEGKPILFSIIEATNGYAIIEFHGGKLDDELVEILGIQFVFADSTKSEVLSGIVYLQFKNVAMEASNLNWVRDAWLRDFIEDIVVIYKVHFERPAGTIPYIWLKIITASVGTLIGLVTVLFIVLRKSTKALVKRYWRIAVLVALLEGTIILGLITWIVADIFQVFGAATIGWAIFLGAEKIAQIKGYLDSPTATDELTETLPPQAIASVQAKIDDILAKYKR